MCSCVVVGLVVLASTQESLSLGKKRYGTSLALMVLTITNLCHVEPQADGFSLLKKKVQLLAVKQVI